MSTITDKSPIKLPLSVWIVVTLALASGIASWITAKSDIQAAVKTEAEHEAGNDKRFAIIEAQLSQSVKTQAAMNENVARLDERSKQTYELIKEIRETLREERRK